MAQASARVTPVTLELGGKDAMVVLEDARLGVVVPYALRGVFQNCGGGAGGGALSRALLFLFLFFEFDPPPLSVSGQNCIGVERVYVQKTLYPSFVKAVEAAVKALRYGAPLGAKMCDVGALVMPAQIDIVDNLVKDAVKSGAKCLAGGKKGQGGQFYEPTLLVDGMAPHPQ
jgi:acyl-CoA reductase-like NAD-dependent aldehyde dehydrogenase